ncbi:zinc finger, c4 type (two domains) domain-containing protein [Ditylenchus destructor]|nr:zinc finger, c4 type (two domains) domain-containing protein [Ditylenchus destructor]
MRPLEDLTLESCYFNVSELANTFNSYEYCYSPTAIFSEIDVFSDFPIFMDPDQIVYQSQKIKQEPDDMICSSQITSQTDFLSNGVISTSPAQETAPIQPSSWPPSHIGTSADVRRMKCSVCGQMADGFHFNALSCAACGAFFRRSIADQKTYSCAARDCDILRQGNATGQKRQIHGSSDQKCAKKMKSSPTISKESPVSDKTEAGILDAICTARRKISHQRMGSGTANNPATYKQHIFNTNYANMHNLVKQEVLLFKQFVLEDPVIRQIIGADEDDNEQIDEFSWKFWLWSLLETALATLRFGGVQTNRIYFADCGYLELELEEFVKFFSVNFPRDAHSLARLALPIAQYFVENVCRSLQAERLGGEHECAALIALILSDCISNGSVKSDPVSLPDTRQESQAKVKQQVFSELLEYYSTSSPAASGRNSPQPQTGTIMDHNANTHPAAKMGVVLLASSAFIDAVAMLRELHYCLKLVQYKE